MQLGLNGHWLYAQNQAAAAKAAIQWLYRSNVALVIAMVFTREQ